VLFIPVPARRQNTLAQTAFAKWINRHIEEWFAFAFSLQIGIQSMNDVVFVTGRDCVKTWLNIAFFGGNEIQDSRVIIGHKVVNESSGDLDVKWRVSPENVHGALLNRGPEGMVCWCVVCKGQRNLKQFGPLMLLGPTRGPMYIYPRFSCLTYFCVLAKEAWSGGGILVRSRQR